MSDDNRPIQVGDLVEVVLARVCCTKRVNPIIFTVAKIEPSRLAFPLCSDCGTSHKGLGPYGDPEGGGIGQPLSWLRRIPPLSELESSHDRQTVPEGESRGEEITVRR